jgi:cell division protein FtsB
LTGAVWFVTIIAGCAEESPMSDKDVQPRPSPYLRLLPPAAHLARSTATLVLAVAAVLLLLVTLFGSNGLGEYYKLRTQHDQMAAERERLQSETEQLKEKLAALRSEPFALEKLARERYNMRRQEEHVILLRPEP